MIIETDKAFDIRRRAILRLQQFAYTIIRKVPVPENINVISRATIEAYTDVDLTEGGKYTDYFPYHRYTMRHKYGNAPALSKLLIKRLFEENEGADFAFDGSFGVIERKFIRE